MNFVIFMMAVAFSITVTGHFGWNALPHSDAELICDGISLVLFALSIRTPAPPSRQEERTHG